MMNRFFLLTLILITTLLFSSCHQKIHQSDLEKTLVNTLSKFPQLPKGQNKQTNFYRLVRSVTIGDNGIELQLRSTPDTLDDPQNIIVVINQTKEQYAIPFFSNTYHDYWSFKFDSNLISVKPINTTFEKELKACLTQLNLYDTLGTVRKVIDEMLFSLLQCEQLTETDSLNVHELAMTDNYSLPYEESDSCFERLKKNWEEIKGVFHPKNYLINRYVYWDKRNNRLYQFNNKSTNRRQEPIFSITNYRLDCVDHMLNL